MATGFVFPEMRLSDGLIRDLRRMNPWWEGAPLPVLPHTRRHLVSTIHRRLQLRLAPIVVVRGPRQIGKTIAQLQVLQDLLDAGVPPRHILRVQCDELSEIIPLSEPILRIVDWYEGTILGQTLNEAAHREAPTYLFFDEIQNLKNWAPQIKFLTDTSTASMLVTGSSALRIELGRDSLAGRMTTIEAGVLSLTEIGRFHQVDVDEPFLPDNGPEAFTRKEFWHELVAHGVHRQEVRDQTFRWFSDRGGYPLVHQRADVEWGYVADQLNETIIRRVIQHDLRVGERGRKRDAPLLEEVFRLACRYIGQSPGLTVLAREAQRTLNANVGPQRINHYLRFLGDTLLLRLIEPLEIRLKRKRGNPKICLADHGLRASWLQEIIPLAPDDLIQNPHLTPVAGHIAESVVGATLATIPSLDIAYLPERGGEPEIDFVVTVGTKRIPLEVKYQRRIDPLADTESLRTFIEKSVNNAPFGLLVTQVDTQAVTDPRIITVPLSTFMMLR
ncbi:MAG: ATP-binding protein [Candidatus Latescibacteria bacterium]|nr:ATP-binding protein [Candidatus Latescibacterota bacterium]